jgi:hypothetical protein
MATNAPIIGMPKASKTMALTTSRDWWAPGIYPVLASTHPIKLDAAAPLAL